MSEKYDPEVIKYKPTMKLVPAPISTDWKTTAVVLTVSNFAQRVGFSNGHEGGFKEKEVEEKSTNMVDISQRKKLTQKPIFKV